METTSIRGLARWNETQSADGPEGLSLLEMMLVVTLILIVASIATPIEAVSSQPSAFSEPADS
jgi:prepilin-type N-terminal cleavage/methylation domain-containing protein